MDILKIIEEIRDFSPNLVSSYCIVNGNLEKLDYIQSMNYLQFALYVRRNMPLKLYRYYPNTETDSGENYSLIALINNTVYLQTPTAFDDIYDSEININFNDYEKERLIILCNKCNLKIENKIDSAELGNAFIKFIKENINNIKDYNFLSKDTFDEVEVLSDELFCKTLFVNYLQKQDIAFALKNTLCYEYTDYIKRLKNIFRVTCFSTTPYSQLMWGGAYANCHRGFCLEYTILPNNDDYHDIYSNLFPIIYCKIRPDMTKKLVLVKDKEFTEGMIMDIYMQGALRKSIDWAYQSEWRLLLPFKRGITDFNVKFFPITKVFLGNRMKLNEK